MEWSLGSAFKSKHARFRARISDFVFSAEHPDVFNVGIVEYNVHAGTLEGYIQLHRRRSVRYIKKWILPGDAVVFRILRADINSLHEQRLTAGWCADVYRRMQDIRTKVHRE
jgi:hypothetical protein